MEFVILTSEIDYPITIRWTRSDEGEYWSNYWATIRRDDRLEGGLPAMEIDITLYILPINRNSREGDEDERASSVGSTDERLTKKKEKDGGR